MINRTDLLLDLIEVHKLLQRIKDALGTDENGEALVEVARNAHRAEMELASHYNGL